MIKLIRRAADLNFDPRRSTQAMPLPQNVLMVRPTFIDIQNAINPHMRKPDGSMHKFSRTKALGEWNDLKAAYEKLGFHVTVVDGVEGLPDMCFCANQSFPYIDQVGRKQAVLSNMLDDTRHKEVAYIGDELKRQGYTTEPIAARTAGNFFESMGDCVWLPGYRFLLGGYGHRTSEKVYETLSEKTGAPVATFELTNPRFYHLDTCLSVFNETSAIACREAFSEDGWKLLEAIFPNLMRVDLVEADSPYFACNAHSPDGKHVVLQKGSKKIEATMKQHGLVPVPVETEEFIKSGGSVFCLKLMFF